MKNLQTIIPIAMILMILTVALPAMTVEGKLEADFSIESIKKVPMSGDRAWKVYANADISFIAASEDGKNFTWDFGDGTATQSKETTTISHRFSSVKVEPYVVILTVKDNDGNSVEVWANLTVVEMPKAILKVTDELGTDLGPEYTISAGDSIILDASGSKGDIESYAFGYNLPNTFQAQVSKNEPTYVYRYDNEGTYNVGLRVTDKLGNISKMDKQDFITITVKKASTTSDSSIELPVPLPMLGAGIGVIVLIIIIVILYRNGYIGGPIMLGSGGSPAPEKKDSPPSPTLNSGMGSNAFIPKPQNLDSLLPSKDDVFSKPPSSDTVYETKTCPKCKGTIPITSLERPLKVTCPDCSASFSLKGKSGGQATPPPAVGKPAAAPPKQDFIYDVKSCPKCKSKIPITSEVRPLKVTCPGCSASFTMKGKSEVKPPAASTPTSPPAPVDDTEVVICPDCGKAQSVSASASEATCVSCGTRFGL